MADSRCQKELNEKDSVDEITDALSLTLGDICDTFNSDVLSSLCSLDITCDRHGNDLVAEQVVIRQTDPLNMQPLNDNDLRRPSCSADGTVPSTMHSAKAGIPERQDTQKATNGMHALETPACTLQKGNVKTSGVQETGVPLDLSIHTREVKQSTELASVSCVDHTIEGTESDPEATDLINAGIVCARSTVTSPLNVTSHMKTGLLTTETRVPREWPQHSMCASDHAKSATDSGEDHTYTTPKRHLDDRMAGPLVVARSTVTSPVNVMSPIQNGLVTTDCSMMSRVTPSRQAAATEQGEHECCAVCNVDEGPVDLSPKQHAKKTCRCASIESHAYDEFTELASGRTQANVAVVFPDVGSLPGELESGAQCKKTSTLFTSKNAAVVKHEAMACSTVEPTLQLSMLPPEIILHVCVFLDARFIVSTLSRVCKTLNNLLGSRAFWRGKLYVRWQDKFPAIPVNEDTYDWCKACVRCEDFLSRWSQPERSMAHLTLTGSAHASVDAIHLTQDARLLVAGSRDRVLNVFDLGKIDIDRPEIANNSMVFTKLNAHQGWVWTMSSLDNVLATGSWDMMVKFWDLDVGQCTHFVRCQSALLCSHLEAGLYVAGAFNWRLYHIDPRLSSIVAVKKYHTHPVLCLAADDRYIISGSEDRTVCVYDRRADKLLSSLTLDRYPMCMSYSDNQLWLGDKLGRVHLVNASQGNLNMVTTYDVGHVGKMTGINHTFGGTFTCCADKTIKVLEPTNQPGNVCTIDCDATRIDYRNGVLASADNDTPIGVWMPRHQEIS